MTTESDLNEKAIQALEATLDRNALPPCDHFITTAERINAKLDKVIALLTEDDEVKAIVDHLLEDGGHQ